MGIVLAATAFLYAPATNHAFTNWDDDRQITANPDIRDLSPQGIRKMFSSFYVSLYQPLTSLSFAVEYRFFGLNPRAYHTVNVLLHLANILLVYVLARGLGLDLPFWVFGAMVTFQAVAGLLPITVNNIGVRETIFCAVLLGQAAALGLSRKPSRARALPWAGYTSA